MKNKFFKLTFFLLIASIAGCLFQSCSSKIHPQVSKYETRGVVVKACASCSNPLEDGYTYNVFTASEANDLSFLNLPGVISSQRTNKYNFQIKVSPLADQKDVLKKVAKKARR
jgi:hypothetical protein